MKAFTDERTRLMEMYDPLERDLNIEAALRLSYERKSANAPSRRIERRHPRVFYYARRSHRPKLGGLGGLPKITMHYETALIEPAAAQAAITQNLHHLSRYLAECAGGEVYDGADIRWAYTGSTALNRIWGAQFMPEQADLRVVAVIEVFRRRRAPVVWFVDANSQPADLGQRLVRSGLTRRDDIGMAMLLPTLIRAS